MVLGLDQDPETFLRFLSRRSITIRQGYLRVVRLFTSGPEDGNPVMMVLHRYPEWFLAKIMLLPINRYSVCQTGFPELQK